VEIDVPFLLHVAISGRQRAVPAGYPRMRA
jgi:hypothetical protein